MASNNFIRNTGDDALAMWSEKTENSGDTFDHNTVQTPVSRQRHRAVRGHRQHGVQQPGRRPDPGGKRHPDRLAVRGRGIHRPRLGHEQHDSTGGDYELNWNIGLGAIWLYALERNIDADIEVVGDSFLDNGYNAIMLVADFPVKDLYSITNVHFKDIKVDGTGTSS